MIIINNLHPGNIKELFLSRLLLLVSTFRTKVFNISLSLVFSYYKCLSVCLVTSSFSQVSIWMYFSNFRYVISFLVKKFFVMTVADLPVYVFLWVWDVSSVFIWVLPISIHIKDFDFFEDLLLSSLSRLSL